ncbi:MAG: hypothetical protein Q4G69_09015 [Planctomycetia bacterium]|nr:hypothetical protein [Planctomycetia bacterium]
MKIRLSEKRCLCGIGLLLCLMISGCGSSNTDKGTGPDKSAPVEKKAENKNRTTVAPVPANPAAPAEKTADPVPAPNAELPKPDVKKEAPKVEPTTTPIAKSAPDAVGISDEPVSASTLKEIPPKTLPALEGSALKEIKESLDSLGSLQIAIADILADKEEFVFDQNGDKFKKLKAYCQKEHLKLVLEYEPFFERADMNFALVETAPWKWSLTVRNKKDPKDTKDSLLLDLESVPKVKILPQGKWKLAETEAFLFANLKWSLCDKEKNKVLEAGPFGFLKPEQAVSSIYFPTADTPFFMDLLFNITLIAEHGALKFLSGGKLVLEPKGKPQLTVPIIEYYNKKKKEEEAKRGSSFSAVAISHPSPGVETIGSVLYRHIVDTHFESFHLNDKTDVGFDFYFINSKNERLLLYHATPM